MDQLSPWVQFGAVGFLFIGSMIAFARGWVYSGKAVDKMVEGYVRVDQAKDGIIVDLKAAIAASERRNEMLNDQVSQLVELGKTSNAVLTSLPGGRVAS
jgi:hypothetical protein